LFPFPRMKTSWLLASVVLLLLIGSGKYYWNYHDDTTAYSEFVVADSLSKKYQARDSIQKRTDSIAAAKVNERLSPTAAPITTTVKKDSTNKKTGDTLTRKQKKQIETWEGIAKKFTWEKKKDSARIKAMQTVSYVKNWEFMTGPAKQREAQWFYTLGLWELASIMLLGMWLFKTGFFFGRYSSSQYMLTALAGIGGCLLFGWYRLHFLHEAVDNYTKYVQQRQLPHTFLKPLEIVAGVAGYASLLMFIIQRNWLQGLRSFFAETGRMALSHYLLQSLILSVFFYGYGMGNYARIGQPGLYLLAVELCILHVVFTVFWTKFYYMGPAEWLLKSLIHRKRIPNKPGAETADAAERPLQTPSMMNHD